MDIRDETDGCSSPGPSLQVIGDSRNPGIVAIMKLNDGRITVSLHCDVSGTP